MRLERFDRVVLEDGLSHRATGAGVVVGVDDGRVSCCAEVPMFCGGHLFMVALRGEPLTGRFRMAEVADPVCEPCEVEARRVFAAENPPAPLQHHSGAELEAARWYLSKSLEEQALLYTRLLWGANAPPRAAEHHAAAIVHDVRQKQEEARRIRARAVVESYRACGTPLAKQHEGGLQ